MRFHVKNWSVFLMTVFLTGPTIGRPEERIDYVAAELQIRNKLALYAIHIDGKDFDALKDIFTDDVEVTLPIPPPYDLVNTLFGLQDVLQGQLQDFVTQHTISTVHVEFTDKSTAKSTAYLVAIFLGQGNLNGQTLVYYGKYTDEWVLSDA